MAEATYVRLGYIDEKATIFVLRVTFAFLASASLFALVATLTYVRAANTAATYVAALSAIINAVAAWHYNEIVKVRLAQSISVDSEWTIDALRCVTNRAQTYHTRLSSAAPEPAQPRSWTRSSSSWTRHAPCARVTTTFRHSDWAVTMPLLILKLYALINNPEHDLILGSVDASALCATLMILLGAYSRLGLDELSNYNGMSRFGFTVGIFAYLGSVALMILLLIDLVNAYSGVENTTIVFAFFLVWPCYALVAFTAIWFRQGGGSSERYPKYIALAKDLCFAALDVFSKSVFAWHTCSAAFGVSVLGS